MQNKTAIYSVIFLAIGMFLGYLFSSPSQNMQSGMHMMPNGEMMSDMGHMMDDMTSGLYGKTGDDFDKAFLEEMIVHHEGAVDMAEMVLSNSKRPELIELANGIISAQTSEISTMKTWLEEWF